MNKFKSRALLILIALVFLLGCFAACDIGNKCDHVEGTWIVDKEATLDSKGERHIECTICGETLQRETIPRETCAHASTKWVVDVEATLDAEGSKHLECKSCGKSLQTEVVPEKYLTQAEVTAKLRSAVVKVICYDYDGETEISQGSGFFIDSYGTFITNAHVVEDCFFIKIQTHLGLTYDVDVMYVYNDIISDYAICKAKNCFSSKSVEFTTKAEVGDTVYALGYPNDAIIMSTTSGKITSTEAVDGTKHYYANTAWIDHGSSGGILADSKGRVIGITTGVFSDGEFAALKYQDFKYDAERIHFGIKAPLEYFHTEEEVWLASYNIDDYFDIYVDATATSDTNVQYWVTVALKDKYRNAKILIDSLNITVKLNLVTEFNFNEVVFYGTVNKTNKDTKYLSFYFYDEGDLKSGERQYTSASTYISYGTEYYGMKITYDIDFSGGNGTLIIYDKYGF